jgi:hypothetical protein
LYGGAAGGGKSEALLMWLAEGIDIPHYSGIIFRRIEDDLTTQTIRWSQRRCGFMGHLGAFQRFRQVLAVPKRRHHSTGRP